jgi:hypothetical protein
MHVYGNGESSFAFRTLAIREYRKCSYSLFTISNLGMLTRIDEQKIMRIDFSVARGNVL